MKTERRHELETNELAIRLGKITEAIQPRARVMVAGIVVIVAVVLVVQYSRSTASTRQQQGWDRYSSAIINRDTLELESLGDEYKDTPVGNWSRLVLADQYLASGDRKAFNDRAGSNSDLNEAITNYEAVRAGAKDDLLQQRARFGLGRTYEALSKLDKATDAYQTVVDAWPASALGIAAQGRLDDMARKQTRQFYDWFAEHKPQAEFLNEEPGTPGQRPDFDLDKLDLDSLLEPKGDVKLDLNAPVTDESTPADSESTSDAAASGDAGPDDAASPDTGATETDSTDKAAEPTSDEAPSESSEQPSSN